MTPVQASTIPLFLDNKDVVVEAVTGSGKTLAFVLPVWEILLKKNLRERNQVYAIVVSPTRELAEQTFKVFKVFLAKVNQSADFQYNVLLLTGGNHLNEDLAVFNQAGGQIIVATPGKLESFLELNSNRAKELEILIMDEADRLLDFGFEKSLRNILSYLPKQRRTGLFSATMTEGLTQLAKTGLRNPMKIVVKVEDVNNNKIQRIPCSLTVNYSLINVQDKPKILLGLLEKALAEKTIVFFATCACVDYFADIFSSLLKYLNSELKVLALHGKMDQKKRKIVYASFLESRSHVLFTTDVSARGLDVPDVDLILHYDPPQDPQAFLHRCGRTARQGKQGKALILLQSFEDTFVEYMRLKGVPMDQVELSAEDLKLHEHLTFPDYYKNIVETDNIRKYIHKLLLEDGNTLKKSIVAFTSFLRSYQEHQLKYVFPMKNLDITEILNGFCLLYLPKCPESSRLKSKGKFVDRIELKDLSIIKGDNLSKQPTKEKATTKKRKPTESWSLKKEAKKKKEVKRLKKEQKKISTIEEDEWKSLQEETSKMKKIKKGLLPDDALDDEL